MRKIGALIFFFLYFTGSAMAQSDFRPGFIVTNAGDTLYGKIDYRGDQLMGSITQFKPDDNSPVQEFFPGDLYGYRFIDNRYFVSRKVKIGSTEQNVFLEYLINGELDVYYYRNNEGDHYFVEKEGGDLVLLPYTEEINIIDSKPFLSKSKRHIGILKTMTQDAPSLNSRLENFRKPDHKNLINLAEDYHKKVSENRGYIVYQEKLPFLKISAEALAGFIKYDGVDDFSGEAGAHLFLWLPRANEKLFFKTGYLVSRFISENTTYKLSKFPVQMQYLYPKNAFRPKFNVGANFYSVDSGNEGAHTFHTVQFGTGFNYKIYKGLFLSTNLATELTPVSLSLDKDISPLSFFAYSFNAGIYVSL